MDANQYQIDALRTAYTPDFVRLEGATDEHNFMVAQLIHAVLGMASEAGELADALKKHIIYKKVLDEVNIVEEIGDLAWYQALGLSAVKRTLQEALEKNNAKLRVRFGDKFREDAAVNRDLAAERKALEG